MDYNEDFCADIINLVEAIFVIESFSNTKGWFSYIGKTKIWKIEKLENRDKMKQTKLTKSIKNK